MEQKKEKGIGVDGGAEYFSKDFEWEELKLLVEGDPSLQYHLLPFRSSSVISEAIESDSEAWKRFHIRHSAGKFFKERRYLLKEFPELVSGEECKVLEVGCGNGSTALPLLRGNENLIVYACDCSKEILERAKMMMNGTDIVSVEHRFRPFYCDLSKSGFPLWLACDSCQNTFPQKPDDYFPDIQVKDETHASDLYSSNRSGCCIGGVNFVTLIFTLSAIPLQGMPLALRECFSVLRPGSLLLFRDYGNGPKTGSPRAGFEVPFK